jgi:PleD family two-component response regulator
MGEESRLKKIVYLDDVNYSLITIKERLKGRYEVYPALSTEKLFEILDQVKIDLILLDINMPEINGYEVIGQVKADKRYKDIPVVFLTSNNDRSTIVKGMGLGAVDVIIKPVSNDNLFRCLNFHLNPSEQEIFPPIVLAIDDSPSILHAVSTILSGIYTVYTVADVKADQVLTELLKKITPDIFILDFNMPVLTGFDLIPIIRKIPGHEETPIIFLTSESSMDHINVAVGLGACDYIIKPINESIFLEKVAKGLRNYKIIRHIRSLKDEGRRR